MYKNLLRIIAVVIINITMVAPSLAEYNSFKLGQSAGAYSAINDLFEKLTKSQCGYVIKKSYSFKATVNEIFPYLSSKDKKEFQSYIDSQEFKNQLNKNDEFISGFLNAGKSDGLDEKTLCGMLTSIAATLHLKAQTQWNYAKQHYSK